MVQNAVESIKLFGKKFNIVSEADQRDRNNTLYAFVRVINKSVYLKLGEARRESIWDRYDGTGCSQHNEMIAVWKSAVRDKPIHKVLKTQFKSAGAGNLLAAAIKAGFDPTKVYGVEIDEEIIKIAHERLVPLGVPTENLYLGDALNPNSYNFN